MTTLQSTFQLIRVLPPQELEKVLYGISLLLQDSSEDILQRVDRPLQILFDIISQKHFLCSDYNKDCDAYRSPWSNTYLPQTESSLPPDSTATSSTTVITGDDIPARITPSGPLRDLEIRFNAALDQYRACYFNGGVSSAFAWNRPSGEEGFGAAFLLQKVINEGSLDAIWSSTHVFDVSTTTSYIQYRLLSTVGLKLLLSSTETGAVDLGVSLTEKRDIQKRIVPGTQVEDVPTSHLETMGPLLESVELDLRKRIEDIYIVKTESILSSLRTVDPIDNKSDINEVEMTLKHHSENRLAKEVMKEMKSHIGSSIGTVLGDASFETSGTSG